MRPRPPSRGEIRVCILALALALGTTGCTSGPVDSISGAGADTEPNFTEPLRPLRSNDLSFFDQALFAGALLAPPPQDIGEGMEVSTAVVVAKIVDVQATRTLVGETGNDRLEMLGVVLQPTEVVHGELAADREEIVVEFLSGSDRDGAVAAMRSSLPEGLAVWFLREADIGSLRPVDDTVGAPVERYYNVIHLYAGVFVQGSSHVIAGPWRDQPADPRQPGEPMSPETQSMKTEGERFATLDDLLAHLRTLD